MPRRWQRLAASLMFAAGCVIAVTISVQQLRPVADRYALIPGAVRTDYTVRKHGCRDADCVRCMDGIAAGAPALVVTGGSSLRRGLDVPSFAAAMPAPVVDCMRNDSRLDAYTLFFRHARVLKPEQSVLHGYNSWAINSPGTWRHATAASFFPEAIGSAAAIPTRAQVWQQYRLLAQIYLTVTVRGAPLEWRESLRHRLGLFDRWNLKFWPLSREEHVRRRIALMRRWFNISPYVGSFVIEPDQVPHEEIKRRHRAFFDVLDPTRRYVFVQAPEMSEVFSKRLRRVSAEARQIMLGELARTPNARHVEVDYSACGVGPMDFWADWMMAFDLAHNVPDSQAKITRCILDAMKRAHIDEFLQQP
jgi:hypothetical protein